MTITRIHYPLDVTVNNDGHHEELLPIMGISNAHLGELVPLGENPTWGNHDSLRTYIKGSYIAERVNLWGDTFPQYKV
jgi:hypothetical protein